jgi:hypothetical protein
MSNKYLRAFRNSLYESPEKKPYCGTCHKAGLPYQEYTNHWTRKSLDPNSEIVCPLILNSVCTKCNKTGHWRKYCPDIFSIPKRNSENQFKQSNFSSEGEDLSRCWFKPINESDIVIEDYRSSDEPPFRPSSPDYPPPGYEDEPKPVKSWAEIVSLKK